MKLSISNIAWNASDDESVYALATKYGYQGIDVAPTRVWSDLRETPTEETLAFLNRLDAHSLKVGGVQSLLFQQPELVLFGKENIRGEMENELKKKINLASLLGAEAVIFGSPKNRIIGEYSEEKISVAKTFFRGLGEYARTQNVRFCIEPNPESYGGDFLTTTYETFEFVDEIDCPGLFVNLDLGTIIEQQEDPSRLIKEHVQLIGHVHISMPSLKPIILNKSHRVALETLKHVGYSDWIAIEMVTHNEENPLTVIKHSLRSLADVV